MRRNERLRTVACTLVALTVILTVAPSLSRGDEPLSFPWGDSANCGADLGSRYQIIARKPKHAPRTQVPIQSLPPKVGYAYGWFGSNPTPQWGRHFGHSKNFTQWSRR